MKTEIQNSIDDQKQSGPVQSSSTFFTRPSGQKFVVFGNLAFDVTKKKYAVPTEKNHVISAEFDQKYHGVTGGDGNFPVKFQGRYWLFENEYEAKILCYTIFTTTSGTRIKTLLWLSPRWLYTNELQLSNGEIAEKLTNELEKTFTATPQYSN